MDVAKTQEIKDLLAAAFAATTAGLIRAAKEGDLAKVQLAVETHKLDPNCTDVRHFPSSSPSELLICSLLLLLWLFPLFTLSPPFPPSSSCGPLPSCCVSLVPQENGSTPLHCASDAGHMAVVQYLVETAKADVEAKHEVSDRGIIREPGDVAPHLLSSPRAVGWGVGRLWLFACGLISCPPVSPRLPGVCVCSCVAPQAYYVGRTPLWHACEKGHMAVVQYLVETAKADVNAADVSGA